jgi:NTE family protein
VAGFRTALVLAGGAARGSYEVGIVDHILTRVARDLGAAPRLDVLCGTSVGAINACMIAAYADDPALSAKVLRDEWLGLRLDQLVRPNTREITRLLGAIIGHGRADGRDRHERRGGLLDPTGIEHVVGRAIPFHRIDQHIASGLLTGLSISTTHVATGRTFIFVQHRPDAHPRWSRDPTIAVVSAPIRAEHALASAALPLLFPTVRIDADYYCDGGLRQNVPLSPARRLGADGLIVVNPRFIAPPPPPLPPGQGDAGYPGLLFLGGKALNALLLDRIDNDIDRLQRINRILDAGTRRFGPGFVDELNTAMPTGGASGGGVRPLRIVHVRASEDIGAMAGRYVLSPEFARRNPGLLGRALRRISEWQGEGEADLLSYLLFDGGFAEQLIELGRRDAERQHDELCAFFTHAGSGPVRGDGVRTP